ncbi:MAG: nicotinate-nucleotide adenylyltransferase [Thermoguttaceae bacterium]|nr:nicotinate-nucleotide adenylyltransferase [Thermoguttaceae bacterium]
MRLGIYGGSFDPVHYAHLLLAETARETCQLDRVIFVPAGIPPHKQGCRQASGEDRFRMLCCATSCVPEFEVSRFEIDSEGISYTIRTLEHFHREWPDAELFLITGSDTLNDIPNWYRAADVCALASLIVARRPGGPEPDFSRFSGLIPDERQRLFQRQVISMPLLELSSTRIRQSVGQWRSIRFQTPPEVVRYIQEHRLYLC